MTDRDRLIEMIKQANTLYLDYLESINQKGLIDTESRAEYIADYLLANGVVVPPCKIGDTLYYPWSYDGISGITILEVSCIKIYVQGRCLVFYTDVESDMPMPNCFTIEDFGKTVFLTREEAEKFLEELNNNGN